MLSPPSLLVDDNDPVERDKLKVEKEERRKRIRTIGRVMFLNNREEMACMHKSRNADIEVASTANSSFMSDGSQGLETQVQIGEQWWWWVPLKIF